MKNNDLALFFVAIKTNILCDADDQHLFILFCS